MKKWIPYIVAAFLGLGVAALMFMPDTATEAPKPKSTKPVTTVTKEKTTIQQVHDGDPDAQTITERVAAERAGGILPPEPGTLRPLNEGEIALAARKARPFNKHYLGVAPFWNRLGPLVGPTDMAVAKECAAMELYLRDQSKLESEDLNIDEVLNQELALEKKIRTLGIDNPELTEILDYINNSAHTTIQGGDPSTITRPGK